MSNLYSIGLFVDSSSRGNNVEGCGLWCKMCQLFKRSDEVFITIELPDAQDVKLRLEPEGKFLFSATSGADKIPYEVDLDLHDIVDIDGSKAGVGNRNITYLVKKAESKWWSRLLKQDGRPPVFLKVDWDRWVDEDEEDQDTKPGPDMDFGEFDLSKMNMGGGEGFGPAEDDDSDTEDENVEEISASKIDTSSSDAEPEVKSG